MARAAVWAGQFYPATARQLGVGPGHAAGRLAGPGGGGGALGALVPHAGYLYSGACAAAAYARLAGLPFGRVLLLGPNHHLALRRPRPLAGRRVGDAAGSRAVDLAAVDALLAGGPPFALAETALAREHSLEVQLPFLQRCLPEARVLPVLVGHCDAAERAAAGARLAALAAPGDFWLVTSDLSHYHPLAEAERLDSGGGAPHRRRRRRGLRRRPGARAAARPAARSPCACCSRSARGGRPRRAARSPRFGGGDRRSPAGGGLSLGALLARRRACLSPGTWTASASTTWSCTRIATSARPSWPSHCSGQRAAGGAAAPARSGLRGGRHLAGLGRRGQLAVGLDLSRPLLAAAAGAPAPRPGARPRRHAAAALSGRLLRRRPEHVHLDARPAVPRT